MTCIGCTGPYSVLTVNSTRLGSYDFTSSPVPPILIDGPSGLPTQGINTSTNLYGDVFPPVNHSSMWAPHVSEQDRNNTLGAAAFVANGAWTNADLIQSGFWFSGLRSADEGPIWYDATSPDSQLANTTAARLVRVDMSATTAPVWTLLPWDPQVVPRAEAGLVWLPYGVQGLLVAFGGVQLPADMVVSGIFPNTTYTNDFMNDIVLYDVGSGNWTVQKTLAPFPAQLAAFCTVSVAAQDNSSHQIYVYGGYDGTYNSTVPQDDHPVASDSIWVLSIPQFKWTLLSDGTTQHRRQNHACVKVNSGQMLTIGGDTEYGLPLGLPDYLDVLDLSSGQWTHQYTVNPDEAYKIPESVVEAVGGSPTGGATIPDDLGDMVRGWLSRPFEGVM